MTKRQAQLMQETKLYHKQKEEKKNREFESQ